jgi:UDP-N-acetylmuramoyl-tripeptide--D-alanyl-D-alanine ligase
MKPLSVEEILGAVGGRAVYGTPGGALPFVTGVSTDTRTLAAGDAFFALVGERHDAHDHLPEAVGKGAPVLVVQGARQVPRGFGGLLVVVADTTRAYQDLAAYYRAAIDPVVIAVTGSVGKTTLKDIIARICSETCNTVCTKGNFNNQIGVPKTILEMPENTETLVLEMGMEWPGEIRRLAEIARPDVAVITNVGVSHREHFDTDDGIRNAKFEIVSFFGADNVLVIDPENDQELLRMAEADRLEKGYSLLKATGEAATRENESENESGCGNDRDAGSPAPAWEFAADFSASRARYTEEGRMSFVIEHGEDAEQFSLPMLGAFAAVSAAMACAALSRFGVSLGRAARALKDLEVTPHRLQSIRQGGVLVIDDTYNASPDSAKSGLAFLRSVPGERKIAVLADMNELGAESERMHRELGTVAKDSGFGAVYTYGDKARAIAEGAQQGGLWFRDKNELIRRLLEQRREGDVYYVKGSRSMKMEDVAEALLQGGA